MPKLTVFSAGTVLCNEQFLTVGLLQQRIVALTDTLENVYFIERKVG